MALANTQGNEQGVSNEELRIAQGFYVVGGFFSGFKMEEAGNTRNINTLRLYKIQKGVLVFIIWKSKA